MQTNRSNTGALIGGAILIAFGLLSLAGQVFRNLNWGILWTLTVIGMGVLSQAAGPDNRTAEPALRCPNDQ